MSAGLASDESLERTAFILDKVIIVLFAKVQIVWNNKHAKQQQKVLYII